MSIFDPETGKVRDKEALSSIGFTGPGMYIPRARVVDGVKVEPWRSEVDGKLGGVDRHHMDGRVDVDVLGRPLTNKDDI